MRSFLGRSALFLALFAVLAELFFRVVIPAAELPVTRYDPDHQILRYDPAVVQRGLFTSGRVAQAQGAWSINAQGWNSEHDYLPANLRAKPAVALFGSSFIEGFYVDLDQNIGPLLEARSGDRWLVYNFGISDSLPSEHLETARYAREAFAPEVLVFFVSPWHIKGMLQPAAGRQRWQIRDQQVVKLPMQPRGQSWLRALGKRSAFARYLILNARLRPDFRPGTATEKGAVVNAAQAGSGPGLTAEELALLTDTLVRRAVTENPKSTVIFATGGPFMADTPPERNPIDAAIAAACQTYGARHLDLTAAFWADWQASHERPEFAHDFHWNAHGFAVVAKALHGALDGLSALER